MRGPSGLQPVRTVLSVPVTTSRHSSGRGKAGDVADQEFVVVFQNRAFDGSAIGGLMRRTLKTWREAVGGVGTDDAWRLGEAQTGLT